MKKINILLVLVMVVVLASLFVACGEFAVYNATLNESLSFELTVGQQDVDFTQYFVLTGFQGLPITVTTSMLDLSQVDLSKGGSFDVTLSYKECTCTATFTVVADNGGNGGNGGNQPLTLAQILAKYANSANWNFVADFVLSIDGDPYQEEYRYLGQSVANEYTYDGETYVDYLEYDALNDAYFYYSQEDDGTYTKYTENADDFELAVSYLYLLDLTNIANYGFDKMEDYYLAKDASSLASEVFADFEGIEWQDVALYVDDAHITKLVFEGSDNYVFTFTLHDYDTVSIDFSTLTVGEIVDGGSTQPDEPADNPQSFVDLLSQYDNYDAWNFTVSFYQEYQGESYSETYDYLGADIRYSFEYDGDNYVEYLALGTDDVYYYYIDNGDGTYTKVDENSDEFWMYYAYMAIFDSQTLSYYEFTEGVGCFQAVDANNAGIGIFGDYGEEDGTVWVSVVVSVDAGKIAKIEGVMDDGLVVSYTFSNYGTVSFVLPDEEDNGGETQFDYQSTFLNSGLSVGKDELQYTSIPGATNYIDGRGAQFAQKNGVAVLTSKTSIDGVTSVTVVVQTNCTTGMDVSVKVGSTSLLYSGNEVYRVEKTSYDVLVTLTFEASSAVSGNIEITLTPTSSDMSMFILTIGVCCGENGGSQGGGNQGGGNVSNMMPSQTYDAETFDSQNLQDKQLAGDDGAIGLPSTGTYSALVIPVQFLGDTITAQQLANLNIAFNGTSAQTGWESVSTYYQKSSFGALNLSFDIQDVYQAGHNSSYYAQYEQQVTTSSYVYTAYGYDLLLTEVLSYYESRLDLTKYDSNNDGCIDAVYLIYSAPVDYTNADFYWAYVTWYYGEQQWDGLDAYYYLFAGIDFMLDDVDGKEYAYGGGLNGLKVNATTYIHETGHLLGLDDYYDYYPNKGCNDGLGGADMMDNAVGDHDSYSKIMLGWITPTIVTQTTTITIESAISSGDCLLIPLDFDNSYFCEYLLVDLYTATGVNALDASHYGSHLFGGASYGVRIYHISSSANDPYSNEYGSYTDYNNSTTSIALIKLVEADGERHFVSDDGYASKDDLWQTGDVLSQVFASYTRNDGKTLNFDITIVSVSETSATITITFNTAE